MSCISDKVILDIFEKAIHPPAEWKSNNRFTALRLNGYRWPTLWNPWKAKIRVLRGLLYPSTHYHAEPGLVPPLFPVPVLLVIPILFFRRQDESRMIK